MKTIIKNPEHGYQCFLAEHVHDTRWRAAKAVYETFYGGDFMEDLCGMDPDESYTREELWDLGYEGHKKAVNEGWIEYERDCDETGDYGWIIKFNQDGGDHLEDIELGTVWFADKGLDYNEVNAIYGANEPYCMGLRAVLQLNQYRDDDASYYEEYEDIRANMHEASTAEIDEYGEYDDDTFSPYSAFKLERGETPVSMGKDLRNYVLTCVRSDDGSQVESWRFSSIAAAEDMKRTIEAVHGKKWTIVIEKDMDS